MRDGTTQKPPIGWIETPFKGNIGILTGFPFESINFNSDNRGKPLIRIRNLLNSKIDTFYNGEYDETFIVTKGDILIAMDGDFRIVRWTGVNALLNQRVLKLVPISKSNINLDFAFYLLEPFLIDVQNKTAGTTVKHLSTKELNKANFTLPPLLEQQKIAEILSTVDEKIEVIGEQIEQTQELKKGLMQRLLTKGIGHTKFKPSPLGEIPESWEVRTLDKLVDSKRPIRYGIVQTGENLNEGIPCLRVADFSQRRFSIDSMIKTSQEISSKYPSTILEEGDIVFPLRGRIGDVKLIDDKLAGINLTRGIALISNSDRILSEYLLWQLQSPSVIKEIMLKVNGTTLQEIPINGLKSVQIPIAPNEEQKEISNILFTVDEKLDVLEDKKEQYQELKKGLMQQLLTGKLRVNHLIEQTELA